MQNTKYDVRYMSYTALIGFSLLFFTITLIFKKLLFINLPQQASPGE